MRVCDACRDEFLPLSDEYKSKQEELEDKERK